jgi:hypothetical protein
MNKILAPVSAQWTVQNPHILDATQRQHNFFPVLKLHKNLQERLKMSPFLHRHVSKDYNFNKCQPVVLLTVQKWNQYLYKHN